VDKAIIFAADTPAATISGRVRRGKLARLAPGVYATDVRSDLAAVVVSEIHPVSDGNGRLARVMMNVELAAGLQSRIIIPTVFRDDYLGALRRLTRQGDPRVLIKTLRYGHDYTAQTDFSTLGRPTDSLRATHAFNEPESAERLQLPPS